MAESPTWSVFAYHNDDENLEDQDRRLVPEWRLDDQIRWCRTRGYDTILLTRLTETVQFEKAPAPAGITHHS